MTYISEISPLQVTNPAFDCFKISSNISRKQGNRISYHLSNTFENTVVVWDRGLFYSLQPPNSPFHSREEWNAKVQKILQRLTDLGDIYASFERQANSSINANVLANLCIQILKLSKLPRYKVTSIGKVKVQIVAEYWGETVIINQEEIGAIALTVKTKFSHQGTLLDFYNTLSDQSEKSLENLRVRNLAFSNAGSGKILGFRGTIKERREELIGKATLKYNRDIIKKAVDQEPVVAVRFGKNENEYHFALASLTPVITQETASRYGTDWGKLLKQTKIEQSHRQELIQTYKNRIQGILERYGINLKPSINSQKYQDLFCQPIPDLNKVELLFGKNITKPSNRIVLGLKEGGLYRIHPDYKSGNSFDKIRISLFKIKDEQEIKVQVGEIRKRIDDYTHPGVSITVGQKVTNIQGLTPTQAWKQIEADLQDLLLIPRDIVIVILPTRDRRASEENSLYNRISTTLIRSNIASQFIYEDTLLKNSGNSFRNILNQIVPGILAKLGNLPYILKDSLPVADYFIGLDVSRLPKQKVAGTRNACASIKVYGRQGNFIKYRLNDGYTEGEEIPKRFLETLLPASEIGEKTVLIYRDGRFVGQEIDNLLEWSHTINGKFILVESRKSQIPRLFNLSTQTDSQQKRIISQPSKGLLMKLSPFSGILVTTNPSDAVGLAKPLRLNIHPEGYQTPIETVAEITLKLTLLHHGSLRPPRLPVPLFAADKMAYRRLQGIFPSDLEGDKQFWL